MLRWVSLALLLTGCQPLLATIRSQSSTGHLVCQDDTTSHCTQYGWYYDPQWYQVTRPPGCCQDHGGPKRTYGYLMYR